MGASHWPLFDSFPALRATLDPISLCQLPSPVRAVPNLSVNAWIKHDDISALEYGGNKMRKLEFVLADVRRRGARRIVTLGADGSNAAVATAMVCQQFGLAFRLISFPQPPSKTVSGNQALLKHYGADITVTKSLGAAIACWALDPRRLHRDNYFMMAGCSQPVAVFAYINAALELAHQVQAGECPMPAHLVVAAGSCSTAAGLSLGASLALPGCQVHAIQVAPTRLGPIEICSAQRVNQIRQQGWQMLRQHFPALQKQPDANLIWHEDYLGTGYGENTLKTKVAIHGAQQLGMALEHTYTGKAFAAYCDLLNQQRGPIMFWNTFNSQPLQASALIAGLQPSDDDQVRTI